ncbi:MAG: hypothetical protein WC878_05520 [Candidatus Paceibacterota bacterium]|jgi:hypothetical protein
MEEIQTVSRQKKVVVFACTDPQIQAVVDEICGHYKKTIEEILKMPGIGERTYLERTVQYYQEHTNDFASLGYTGFILIEKYRTVTLCHETEELKELFPEFAFDAWVIHKESAHQGLSAATKVS